MSLGTARLLAAGLWALLVLLVGLAIVGAGEA